MAQPNVSFEVEIIILEVGGSASMHSEEAI